MAWINGTCNGHLELLSALKTFLTTNAELVAAGQNWTVNKDQTIASYATKISGTYGAEFRELYLQGPGLTNEDAVHVGIRAFDMPSSSAYNWLMSGYTSFDTNALFEEQPGTDINRPGNSNLFFILTNATIEYWFVANGRRFIVIAKIGGDFFCSYCGFIDQYGTRLEYPMPIFISANSQYYNTAISSTQCVNWWGVTAAMEAKLRDPGGSWVPLANSENYISTSKIDLWPERGGVGYSFQSYPWIANPDGTMPILPHILYSFYGSKNIYGELDGSFAVPGYVISGLAPVTEDTITIGSDTYLIVQNCDKTDRSAFAAIKLE